VLIWFGIFYLSLGVNDRGRPLSVKEVPVGGGRLVLSVTSTRPEESLPAGGAAGLSPTRSRPTRKGDFLSGATARAEKEWVSTKLQLLSGRERGFQASCREV